MDREVSRGCTVLEEGNVVDLDQLKAEIKKLSSQAIQAKMDLHDLKGRTRFTKSWNRNAHY